MANEPEAVRLAALEAYGILDTPEEKGFEEIVQLIARICDTPIGLVALIDRDRQWFKAKVGIDISEISRPVSFCEHGFDQSGLFVVPDAACDPRFADNPLVTGEPGVRFYAGMPLVNADGLRLGTLCALDVAPRPDGLDDKQALALQVLAGQVMAQLELRKALRERSRTERDQRLLSQELSHRIKNIFAVVSALISLSARQHPEARPFADGLRTRLGALARAHEFVSPASVGGRPASGVSLHAFLGELFGAYVMSDGSPRIVIEGDDASFDDQAATPVALLFHELATNAAKYGALSRDEGRVRLASARQDDRYVMVWEERNGPLLAGDPMRQGFGSGLVTLSVEGQLGGRLSREWLREGLRVTVDLPGAALSRGPAMTT